MNQLCNCVIHPLSLEEVDLFIGPFPFKGMAFRERGMICLSEEFMATVKTSTGRYAVLFHEVAHLEGADCERCADRRAGERLEQEGWNLRDALVAYHCGIDGRSRDEAMTELMKGYGVL